MMKSFIWITAFLLAVLMPLSHLAAQLLIPEVVVDMQPLPEEARTKLAGLDSILTKYLEDQQWAGDDYQYDFPVQLNIYFTEYNPDPLEDKYKAKLIATNKKDQRFEDTRWEFGLRQSIPFRSQEFHSFKSVIEFYVWMLFGTEFDKLEKLGGQTYYDRARGIYLQSSSSVYYFGWDRRNDLLRAQTDDANKAARELNFFYYTGMYFDEEKNYRSSKDYLYYAMTRLTGIGYKRDAKDIIESVSIDAQKRFLETNHRNLTEALIRAGFPQDSTNRDLTQKWVRALIQVDPQRRDIYESIAPEGGNGHK